MIDFHKISVNQMVVISQIINDSTLYQQGFIEARYSRVMSNYQTMIEFLKELKLIKINKDAIILNSTYKYLLHDIKESNQPKEVVSRFLIKQIFNTTNQLRDYANKFLSKFSFRDENYEFKPTLNQKLKYSGIRNFLMELHLLDLDTTNTKYIVQNHFLIGYSELNEGRRIPEKNFKIIQRMKEEIGRAAELAIIEYEKDRLSKYPQVIDKIEHTAIKDASAGYDIKSFECQGNDTLAPRFIEVKAVSSWNYRFYWTKNEIDTSKQNREGYYLYLLPVYTKNEFDLENLKIIYDPFKFENYL